MKKKFLLLIIILFIFSLFTLGNDKKIIVLDAGHGGSDNGIIRGNFVEKNINLRLAKNIGENLSQNGEFKVIFTREGDEDLSIEDREVFANNGMGDLFLSIHCGAFQTDKNFGVVYLLNEKNVDISSANLLEGTIGEKSIKFFPFKIAGYYFLPKSEDLANSLQSSLNNFYNYNVIKKPIPLKIKVLENIIMPGVLIEAGNLNSKSFSDNDNWYNSISNVISNEIIKFFNNEKENE